MKNLLNFTLPIIPLDKANHFIYGFIIFIISSFIITIATNQNSNYTTLKTNVISLLITTLFALFKEIKDQITYKGFCWADLLTTIIPSILITLLDYLNMV